ncbi:MAG: NAD-dependent epimerase/dehydratase family protein [Candidatus Peribacteraceae bacterium]|nr:NAD-dependent epimerase/dehydratase family protein [Candidatus Peribacteraceae bacterium]MDD5074750.1 NAD-dependent epimerase/dehydratase family protein [Candidatus Peribacteraceae bacterium]
MKILVTGSSGTIGTRLCEKLMENGHEVKGFDWKPNKWQPAVQKITTQIDLRDLEKLKTVGKVPADILVHLAANARVYDLVEQPELARDNMLTVFNALEYARLNGIKRFVFASSRETYGNSGATRYSEDMVRVEHCESAYTASKIAGEALVESYKRCYGIDTVILRFSNVYGMYDDSDRVVPLFIRRARKNEALTIFGKDKSLDFTYIDDTVAGIMLILEKFDQAKNDTYNIAFGKAATIVELAELLKKLLNSSSTLEIKPSRTGEVTNYTADITKAASKIGFAPKIPFEEGVRKAVEWYKKAI